MIEKPTRPKKPNIQDRQPPRTIDEVMRRFDLDNIKVYDFLDYLVDQYNKDVNSEWKSANINTNYFRSGQIHYKQMGDTLFIVISEVQLDGSDTTFSDNTTVLFSGLPEGYVSMGTVLLLQGDGTQQDVPVRVKLKEDGTIVSWWTKVKYFAYGGFGGVIIGRKV